MRILVLIVILMPFSSAHADRKFGEGMVFDFDFGYGASTIKNPDRSSAEYRTLAVATHLGIPLYESDKFTSHFLTGLRYLDLENNANTSSQSEVANLIGPEVGIQFRLYKFFAAYEYGLMSGRHYAVGTISHSTKYQMPLTTLTGGVSIPLKSIAVSFSYSQSTGSIPKSGSKLSKDAPYSDQIYWIQLNYFTNTSFLDFVEYLF